MLEMASGPPPCLPHPPKCLYYNRHEARDVESLSIDDVGDGPSTPEVLPRSERLTRKKRQVVGNSLLRGTDGPIWWTDPMMRSHCGLSILRGGS